VLRSTPYTYEEMNAIASNHTTVPVFIANKDCAVVRLTLCTDAASCRLALLLSMHHHAGDAHTYYRILNMLSDGGEGEEVPIEALNPVRAEGFLAWMADHFSAMIAPAATKVIACNFISLLLCCFLGLSQPMEARVHFVDANKIAAAKAEALVQVATKGTEGKEGMEGTGDGEEGGGRRGGDRGDLRVYQRRAGLLLCEPALPAHLLHGCQPAQTLRQVRGDGYGYGYGVLYLPTLHP
jgi:hypothetical protein